MALDYGRRRVGVALTDPLGMTAQPQGFLDRRKVRLLDEIEAWVQESEVTQIVVGVPRRTDGTEGPEAEAAWKFIDQLRDRLNIPVDPWEEWFSTAQAERSLIETGMRRQDRKDHVDAVAASLILQSWMAAQTSDAE
jgi:putative Holliday junction resolvase